jgi:threonine/homoserine/homoserine lactone efflux protein
MPSSASIVAFGALSSALIVVPGPSVMFVVSRAVALGRRAALLTVLGNAAGAYVQVVSVALGLGVVVERSALAFNVIRFLGAAYLVWLGVQAIRHRRALSTLLDPSEGPRPRRTILLDGFVVGFANPKVIVFFAAILPQYVQPGGAPAGLQMAFRGLVFVAIALLSDSVWGLVAGTARQWFARSPRRLELLGGTGRLVIIGLGLRLAVTGRDD